MLIRSSNFVRVNEGELVRHVLLPESPTFRDKVSMNTLPTHGLVSGKPRQRKLLLVTASRPGAPNGGREQLYDLNERCLADIFAAGFHRNRLETRHPRSFNDIRGALQGETIGPDKSDIARIAGEVRSLGIDQIFLDGSNLGGIARTLRAQCPGARIHTFFHNVEARFFLGALRARPSPRALAVLVANFAAERAAVHNSDSCICLSRRDSELLKWLHGRGADFIAPMALADKLGDGPITVDAAATDRYLLFVGGAFYANSAGIRWFANKVAPRAAMRTVVIGRGMESLTSELAGEPGLEIVGEVEDLRPWYLNAYAVIAPIFDGSGMKTKVAEALMFGKRIIGTAEAFSGYDRASECGWLCKTSEDFVAAITAAASADLPRFDRALRQIYEQEYSTEAARGRLSRITAG